MEGVIMTTISFEVPSITVAKKSLAVVSNEARGNGVHYANIARFVLGTPGKRNDIIASLNGSRANVFKALAGYQRALTAVKGDHSYLTSNPTIVGAFVSYYNQGLRKASLETIAESIAADGSPVGTPLERLDIRATLALAAMDVADPEVESHGETEVADGTSISANGGNVGGQHAGTGDTSGAGDAGQRSPLEAINSAVRAVQSQTTPSPGEIALLTSATELLVEAIQALAARAV